MTIKCNQMIKQIALAAMIFLTITTSAFSVPMNLSYQGFILDNNGSPINGTVNIMFNLYLTEVDNQSIWAETHNQVMVSDGIFNVILGIESPLKNEFFNDGLYLGISIDESSNDNSSNDNRTEMQPRRKFTSSAFAIRAGVADAVDGNNIDDHSIDITKLAFADQDGNIEISGNIKAGSFIGDGSQLTGIVNIENDPIWRTESENYWTKEELKRNNSREDSGAFNLGVSDSFFNTNSSNLQDVLADFDMAISNNTVEMDNLQTNLEQTIINKLDQIDIPDFSWEEVTTNDIDFDTQCEYRWDITSGHHGGQVFYATWLGSYFLCCDYSTGSRQCIYNTNVKESTGDVGTFPARVFKRCLK